MGRLEILSNLIKTPADFGGGDRVEIDKPVQNVSGKTKAKEGPW